MHKTKNHAHGSMGLILVDLDTLCGLLCCGQTTAKKIAEDAEARFTIGRRVLYSVEKIQKYVLTIAI